MIIAHRGASADGPENTLAAFRLAWDQQADGIEADFHLTRDGHLVCIHDADTKRTGGQHLCVAESTLAELRRLEYGSWKSPEFRGEPLPTLADVIRILPPRKLFVIELKSGPEIVPVLSAELDRLQPDGARLLLISFQKDTIAACRELLPGIRTHWLVAFRQEQAGGAWTPGVSEVIHGLQQTGANGLGMQASRDVLTTSFVNQLFQNGMQEFHVWTVDRPADALFYRSLGAKSITTNRPGLLREHLRP